MSEEVEGRDKEPRKTDAGDIVAWLVIAWLGISLIWVIADSFLLGGFQNVMDMLEREGVDVSFLGRNFLALLGVYFINFMILAAGAWFCFEIKRKHGEGGLTSGATALICIVALFVIGFLIRLWQNQGDVLLLFIMDGRGDYWHVLILLELCYFTALGVLLAPFAYIWDRFFKKDGKSKSK